MNITSEQLEDYLMTLGFEPGSSGAHHGLSRISLHWRRNPKATVRFAFLFWEATYDTYQQGTHIDPNFKNIILEMKIMGKNLIGILAQYTSPGPKK